MSFFFFYMCGLFITKIIKFYCKNLENGEKEIQETEKSKEPHSVPHSGSITNLSVHFLPAPFHAEVLCFTELRYGMKLYTLHLQLECVVANAVSGPRALSSRKAIPTPRSSISARGGSSHGACVGGTWSFQKHWEFVTREQWSTRELAAWLLRGRVLRACPGSSQPL